MENISSSTVANDTVATPVVAPVMVAPANATVVTKGKRKTIPKLTAVDLSLFPGAIAPVVKTAETKYYLMLDLSGTGKIGTSTETTTVHEFAQQLDTEAKAKAVGEVTAVSVTNGVFEVVLALTVTGAPASHGDPAANAFTQLKDYFGTATLLTQGLTGKAATWKAKVNGTTIIEGAF